MSNKIQIGWIVVGIGKFGEKSVEDRIIETNESSLTYWQNRGYSGVPIFVELSHQSIFDIPKAEFKSDV